MRRAAALGFVAAFAAALLSGAGPADAGAPETVDLAAEAAQGSLRTDWYGVFCDEQQVGWMRRSLVRTEYGTVPAVERVVELHIDVVGDGNDLTTTTTATYRADPPQELLRLSQLRSDAGRVVHREVRRVAGNHEVATTRRGATVHGVVAVEKEREVRLADDLAFERLARVAAAREGGPVGATILARALDIATVSSGERELTVSSADGEGAARELTVVTGRESTRIDRAGAVLSGTLGGRFTYRRQSEAIATDRASRSSLEALSRVALDAKLDPGGTIRTLEIAWDAAFDRVIPATDRQRLRAEGKTLFVKVVRDADLTEAPPEELRDALAADEGLDLESPEVLQTATQVLSGTGGTDPVAERGPQVKRIATFVSRLLEKEPNLANPSALEILRMPRRAGDCTEHVRLFVALCRAAGIPAREVHGLAWGGDEVGAFRWHLWAEAAPAGRWISVEPTTGEIPAPATNVAVNPAPDARTLLWGAKFRLVSVERDPPPK